MKIVKKIIILVTLLVLVNSIFAITTDITFHSKFDKENSVNLNFNGFPAHSFKQQEQNFKFVKDTREKEINYIDLKKDYNKERKGKFNEFIPASKDLYKFETKYQNNDYQNIKFDYLKENNAKINYFNQNNLRFKTSEMHFRNDY